MNAISYFFRRRSRGQLLALTVTLIGLLSGGALSSVIEYVVSVTGQSAETWRLLQLLLTSIGVIGAIWLATLESNKQPTARFFSLGQVTQSSARKGLILLISTRANATPEETRAGYEAAMSGQNPDTWGAPIKAIQAHSSRLEHLWLISTEGSFGAAQIIKQLVNTRYPDLKVHCHNTYCVSGNAFDDRAIHQTQLIADQIFETARTLNLSNRELIADITGATKPVSLGMAFSCFDATRDIQYTSNNVSIFGFETLRDA